MKTISFLNVKGGVGKTISAVNFAYILSNTYNKRVLLIDLDKQGNSSMTYGVYDDAEITISDLLVNKNLDTQTAIYKSEFNVDVIPSNMELIKANQTILLDTRTSQQTRLKKHLDKIKTNYDYCIIDCPTDLNMSSLNALTASDDVLIPIKIDRYSFVGLSDVIEIVEDMKDFNPNLQIKGAFLTMYQKTNIQKQGFEHLENVLKTHNLKLFNTYIRNTTKVMESTFEKPVVAYDKNCTASLDYFDFVAEYLNA